MSPAEPIFRRDGDLYVPTDHARGPWEAEALHGGAPAALLADAVAAAEPGAEGSVVVRLTYDFLGPVPFAPLAIAAQVVRPGRRFQLVEATLAAAGREVIRVRAVRLRRGAVELPAGLDGADPRPPGPETARADAFPPVPGMPSEGFHRTGMEIRFTGGTDFGEGPALAWFRLGRPLVDDRPPSPLARVAAAADFGNGVAHVVPFTHWLFVNTDLTIHLHREPVGEWILLDARTRLDEHGVGTAASTLHDERGAIGLAAQSLFVERR